jgi:hypothetical protein
MSRIAAREKFPWRGWEFRLSRATKTEAHWELRLSKLRVRLIYRDLQDPEVPPEWTALIHFQGLEEGHGESRESLHEGGNGVAGGPEAALALAERDFLRKCAHAARMSAELRRGKAPDSES